MAKRKGQAAMQTKRVLVSGNILRLPSCFIYQHTPTNHHYKEIFFCHQAIISLVVVIILSLILIAGLYFIFLCYRREILRLKWVMNIYWTYRVSNAIYVPVQKISHCLVTLLSLASCLSEAQ